MTLLSNNQILHHRLNIIIKRAKFPLPFFLSNKTKRVVSTWKEHLLQEKTQFLTNFIKPQKLKNMGKHHRMINMKLPGCPFLPICKKWQSRLCLFFKGLACTHSANCGRAVCRAQSQGLFRASTSQSSYLLCPSLVLWLWAAFILGHPIFKFFLFPAENYADVFRQSKTQHSTQTWRQPACSRSTRAPHSRTRGRQQLTQDEPQHTDSKADTRLRLNCKEGKGHFNGVTEGIMT